MMNNDDYKNDDERSDFEKVLTDEVEQFVERIGQSCIVTVTVYDDDIGGFSFLSGAWRDEVDQGIMLRETIRLMNNHYQQVLQRLFALSVNTAGNA